MSTETPEVKADSAVKEEAKTDAPETKETSETNETKAPEKAEKSPIETETTEPVAEAEKETTEPVAEAEETKDVKETPASKDEGKVSAKISTDDIANEIGAAMVSLGTEKKATEVPPSAETKEEDVEVQVQLAKESSDEETEEEDDNKEMIQAGTASTWDNSYSTDLKKIHSDVDADTRAVAEEMIRAATAGKAKPAEDSEVSKSTPETKEDEKMETADDSKEKEESRDDEKPVKKPMIAKGQEPSALELALKQQGITQSDQLRSTQFPFRLHNMLDEAERCGHAHIVSWCPGGDSFKIHKPAKLIQVLQRYFRQSKFKSFLRQLQGYNFKRITRGKDQGVVSHPLFLRGRRSVSTLMRRKRVGPKPDAEERTSGLAAAAAAAAAARKVSEKPNPRKAMILAQGLGATQRPLGHPVAAFLNKAAGVPPPPAILNNPHPQDVLCVDSPNGHQVKNFQGNRKLASIVQKITGHYTSANESVRSMIVNEIASRIQNSGSRFLKLSKDGLSWVECNREEMFRKGMYNIVRFCL